MQRRPNAGLKMGLGAVAVLFAAACGAAGGGGGGTAMTGGAPGSTCNTKYQSEGCVGPKKTGCVALPTAASPDAGEWKDLGDCTSSEYCAAEVNPADSAKKIAVCKANPTGGGTDTVGAGDGDSTSSGDALTYSQAMQCVKASCSAEFAACKADSGCGVSANCFEKCADEKCADACPDMPDGNKAGEGLAMCMLSKGCIPTTQPDPKCGDGKCDSGETPANCSQDCKTTGPVCGNGTCESGETTANCGQDCKATGPVCGDGKCEGNEIEMCAKDCATGPVCGNGKCESGENTANCKSDCPATTTAKCGDLKCDAGEASTCPLDCNSQYASSMTCAVNGCSSQWTACMNDAKCKGFFNCAVMCDCNQSCIQECGVGIETNSAAVNIVTCSSQKQCPDPCAGTGPVCGNGKCESGETKTSCAKDCSTGPVCGNGTCESGETAASCAKDCTTSTGHFCDSNCGGPGTECFCDSQCAQYGDCCTAAGTKPATANKTCAGSSCAECNGAP